MTREPQNLSEAIENVKIAWRAFVEALRKEMMWWVS